MFYVLLTRDSLRRELVHLDGGVEDLDAELVHHEHAPLHLARLLVVPQDIAQDPCSEHRHLQSTRQIDTKGVD